MSWGDIVPIVKSLPKIFGKYHIAHKIKKGDKSFLESVVSCLDQQLSFWSNFAKTFADAGSMLCELESS